MAWPRLLQCTHMETSLKGKSAAGRQAQGRAVRSFVLRSGRLTEGQKRALDELWPRYGIESATGMLDFPDLFGNRNPVILDIGFGNGESTWQMATANPDENFLGVEVHRPGVGHLLLNLATYSLGNVRIACTDAVEFLQAQVPDDSLAGVRLYFPDPWPKKRHHKRRLVQPAFAALAARKLAPRGTLHAATDWPDYAEYMNQVFSNEPLLGPADCGFAQRPATKFENRGKRLGHPIRDLYFRRR